jgi:hypothetical protein
VGGGGLKMTAPIGIFSTVVSVLSPTISTHCSLHCPPPALPPSSTSKTFADVPARFLRAALYLMPAASQAAYRHRGLAE